MPLPCFARNLTGTLPAPVARTGRLARTGHPRRPGVTRRRSADSRPIERRTAESAAVSPYREALSQSGPGQPRGRRHGELDTGGREAPLIQRIRLQGRVIQLEKANNRTKQAYAQSVLVEAAEPPAFAEQAVAEARHRVAQQTQVARLGEDIGSVVCS